MFFLPLFQLLQWKIMIHSLLLWMLFAPHNLTQPRQSGTTGKSIIFWKILVRFFFFLIRGKNIDNRSQSFIQPYFQSSSIRIVLYNQQQNYFVLSDIRLFYNKWSKYTILLLISINLYYLNSNFQNNINFTKYLLNLLYWVGCVDESQVLGEFLLLCA